MNLQDQVAIVTGGASGIGRGIGQALANQGAQVVLADIDRELAEKAAEGMGGRAQVARVDVTDAAAVQKLVDDTIAEHGRLDFMFNNAGIAIFGEVRDMSLDLWRRIVDINLNGVIHGVAAAYPRMIEQGFGHIINTSSGTGLIPSPIATAYSTTKHAVVGLSTSLRAEAVDLGVKVSVVCPGFIETPMKDSLTYLELNKKKMLDQLPIKFYSPEYCAKVVLRGIAKNKAIITVTPLAKLAWILYRWFPGLALWFSKFPMREARKKYTTAKRT